MGIKRQTGPKPRSLHLLKQTGDRNHGSSPISKNPPKFDYALEATQPPESLSPYALEEWERLAPALRVNRLLSSGDISSFQMYCEAWAVWRTASDLINAPGFQLTREHPITGNVGKHPILAVRDDAHRQVLSLLSEFGLTPAARSKMSIDKDSDADGMDSFIQRRGTA